MVITGELLTTADLESGAGEPFEVRILRPAATPDQILQLNVQSQVWLETARGLQELAERGQLDEDVAQRAIFTSEVLFFGALQLAGVAASEVLIAVHGESIVGVTLYGLEGDEATLTWVAVAPQFLAGAPTPADEQVRGIGTAMICAVSQQFEESGATTVRLTPLDEAAAHFWVGRGFTPCWAGAVELCVQGRDQIEQMAAACAANPDDGAAGDVCICGTFESLRDIRLPELRAMMPGAMMPGATS